MPCAVLAADDSGTFRGRWWNYYDRGVAYSEKVDWDRALADLKKAASMRDRDQRMARTYGMHFIDYFPHRELGIVHLGLGDVEKAIKELETSIAQEESARAMFYLNRARRAAIEKKGARGITPPVIVVTSPAEGSVSKGFAVKVSGRAAGDAYVAKLFINNEPIRFDLARKEMPFEKEVPVGEGESAITIVAQDLLGKIATKKIGLLVDREGPNINIVDVLPATSEGRRQIRVKGEVTDGTGIRRVILNGKEAAPNNAKTYAFDIAVDRNQGPARLVIQAFDSLDNETQAEMDLEKEVVSFNRRPAPVMLASNGPKIFSLDKEPPVVTLKESGDPLTVFVDRYYVEGEASDNSRVDRILVNDVPVTTKGGKKVFFSKVVKLREGENRITVTAIDGADNKAGRTIVVKKATPAVMQVGSRVSVSILPFDVKQKDAKVSQHAFDELTGSFVEQKRFRVIERAKLEQILLEQKLSREKLTDPQHSIRVGKLLAAETILASAVSETPKAVEVVSRIINTETSEVMAVKDAYTEDKTHQAVKELMEGLASKIAAALPLAEGMVLQREGATVFTDLGTAQHLKKDMGVIIFRKGKEIKHPVTGKSLGFDTVKLAEGNIEDLQKDFSKIRLSPKSKADEIRAKDLVITK
jgi:hypothetical protein